MRSTILATVMAFALAGCGDDDKPAKKEPEFKSDPKGNLCLACNLRTDGATCKKCKAVLKAEMPAPAPRSGPSEVGKSAVAPLFACPKEGCTFTDARKGTCLKHSDTEMKISTSAWR